MKRAILVVAVCVLGFANVASADTFGTGANEFTIDFVGISGSTNPSFGRGIVNNDYRIAKFEIRNDQWNKFEASYGTVTGSTPGAYVNDPYWAGSALPVSNISWYEAVQFVNYLNTSKGYQAAYKFTGTKGTGSYTFGIWEVGDTGYDAGNPLRNSNAHYFLPTENEWVKAAFWNGANLQTYASIDDSLPVPGVDSNYDHLYDQPWKVFKGAEELNGTFNMMGNVWEWLETPYQPDPEIFSLRGTSFGDHGDTFIKPNAWAGNPPDEELFDSGFRVASAIPEPCSLVLLGLGGFMLRRKMRR